MRYWRSVGLWCCVVLVMLVTIQARAVQTAPVATTYYVRPDGGNTAQCTGRTDEAYPGSGVNQPCAWNHPFMALPPGGSARIVGGDTLIIAAGSYRMGIGAPGAELCTSATISYDCTLLPIPSGPSSASPTRLLGSGWDTGCDDAPELWGTGRPWHVLDLTNSNNVELGCLEITDHSKCIENYPDGSPLKCQRDTPPYGDWAAVGLWAEESANVYIHDVNIHGLAGTGIVAGRLSDWRLEDVQIVGNAFAGWDGELHGQPTTSANSGQIVFRRVRIEWNGCAEDYPDTTPIGCWSAYGDGLGTAVTGGQWLFEDSTISHNTSDGLDLLYLREPNSSLTVRRSRFEGNAGNQFKTYRGPLVLENSIVIGNCGFFDGKAFTASVTNCRAQGSALSLGLAANEQALITNTTIASEGDCLAIGHCNAGNCNGSEKYIFRNTIFQGYQDFLQGDKACLVYQESFPSNPFDVDYALINGVKNDSCLGQHSLCGVQVGVVNAGIDSFDAHLLSSSPAINTGQPNIGPASDFDGKMRDTAPDIGAYEYGAAVPLKVLLPAIGK